MKFLCFCLCISLLFVGCGVQPTVDAPLPNAEPTAPVLVNRIDTAFFSLTVPDSWLGDASWVIQDDPADGSYDLRFTENQSAQDEYGGHLFTVSVIGDAVDYTQFPSFAVLGSIKTGQGPAYNIIVRYPTDVQFSPAGAQRYQAMYEEIPGILQTICYHDCSFSDQVLPVTSQY